MQPLLGMLSYFNGIPSGFWQDEFVLGFFTGMISFHLDRSKISLSTTDKGFLFFDVFTALSHQNGEALAGRAARLARLPGQSLDFDKGVRNSEAIALATEGRARPDYRQVMEEALEFARLQKKPGDGGEVVAHLLRVLFLEEVRKRFDLE